MGDRARAGRRSRRLPLHGAPAAGGAARRRSIRPRLAALLLCLTGIAPAAFADARTADEAAVLRVRAAQLAAEDRCAEALPLVRRARELAPDDARAALLEGQCLYHEKRYDAAVPALERAERLDPGLSEAPLLLGMAHYHRGDLAQADEALGRAEALAPERAELSFYQGLVLLDRARADDASERFDRAARLGTPAVEPAASFYAGLAHAGAGRRREAEEALTRVGRLAPGSEWQRRADEALATASREPELRHWLLLRGGLEYDSNVVLRGDDVSLPNDISDSDDGRGLWGAEAGAELFRTGAWSGGALASYGGTAQFEQSDFDQQAVVASLWVDRRLDGSTLLRAQPEFGAIFLDYDGYLRFYGLLAELFHDWGGWGEGRLYARYEYDDYRYDILGTGGLQHQRDRDGHGVLAGYDHAYAFATTGTVLSGGPFYRFYESDGREYRFQGGGGWLGLRQDLPFELVLDLEGSLQVARYRNPSSFRMPGEGAGDRRDLLGTAEVGLERSFGERVTASARWGYYNSDSNTRVFDYDRHIVGVYVTIALLD